MQVRNKTVQYLFNMNNYDSIAIYIPPNRELYESANNLNVMYIF